MSAHCFPWNLEWKTNRWNAEDVSSVGMDLFVTMLDLWLEGMIAILTSMWLSWVS